MNLVQRAVSKVIEPIWNAILTKAADGEGTIEGIVRPVIVKALEVKGKIENTMTGLWITIS